MKDIDFSEMDGGTVVGRKNAGVGSKLGIICLGIIAAAGLVWINLPKGNVSDAPSRSNDEVFNPAGFLPNGLPESAMQAPAEIETIVVPPPAESNGRAVQAENVDQVVVPGVDMEAQRKELEDRLAQEARAKAEAAERERLNAAAEEEARRKLEDAELEKAMWERFRSNQIISNDDAGGAANSNVQVSSDGQIVQIPGADTDPNKAFLAQSERSSNSAVKAKTFRRTDALISEGTMIRGFLETAINTDLPGMVRAVVREDVYSLDGRRVLIPKGSRLTGEYRSGLARGQKRVFIVWNRVIRADGTSVSLNSPGADNLGRAGMGGRVDTHWLERYGNALMLSLVGGVSEFLSSLSDDDGNQQRTETRVDPVTGESIVTTYGNGRNEARSIAIERSAASLQQLAQDAFRDTQNIGPTIYVDQGTSVVVFVRRDLDFSDDYPDPVAQELARLKRGGAPRRPVDPTPLYLTPKDNFTSSSLGPKYFPPAPPVWSGN
ncbi:type IV secretion system protein VirB10 [Agrobacterium tumefaciens]|uniref:type IV secretion system protein VirB10 n=1 Tax=Agrobacterium tumefaciens TaxID=358 RepID=UPI0015718BA3|nr:type IV secretion system protein VirB10 [Agrobacterium tumefaciens]NTE37663.1 TrbI/VirB10 family protein [Agrobacterium tumefaciens]NTE53175.1 TrbI/VirB10 family protein [Agrobacterium tumefaciens]